MFSRLSLRFSMMLATGSLTVTGVSVLLALLLWSLATTRVAHKEQMEGFSETIAENQRASMTRLRGTIEAEITNEVDNIRRQQREDGLAALAERGTQVAGRIAEIIAPWLADKDDTWVDETCRAAGVDLDIGVIVVRDERNKYYGGYYDRTREGLVRRLPVLAGTGYHTPDDVLSMLVGNPEIADTVLVRTAIVKHPSEDRQIGDVTVLLLNDRLAREGEYLAARAERLRETARLSLEQGEEDLLEAQAATTKVRLASMERESARDLAIARNLAIAAGLATLVGLLIAIAVLSSRLLAPLRDATRFATQLGAGDLSRRLPPGRQPDARDLILSLNAMADALQSRIREIDLSVEELKNAFTHSQAAAVRLDDGAGDIIASCDRFMVGASQLRDAMGRILEAMGDMGRHAAGNAKSIGEVTTMSGVARADAERGVTEMHTLQDALVEVEAAYGRFASMMKMIDDIAFQTSLLSLNASIEAARAGRHGKGFSVVASEVRSLAARSTETAAEVRREMEAAEDRVQSAHKLADASMDSFSKIAGSATRIASFLDGVRAASNEQTEGVRSANVDVERIAHVADTNHEEAQRIVETVTGLSRMAQELRRLVTRRGDDRRAPEPRPGPDSGSVDAPPRPALPLPLPGAGAKGVPPPQLRVRAQLGVRDERRSVE